MKIETILKSLLVVIALSLSAPVFSDPPAQSGLNVVRFEDGVGFNPWDPDKDIQAVLGFDAVAYCNENYDFDIVPIMEVNVPQDADRIKQLIKGEVQATFWGFSDWDCDRFMTELPLGYGMVQIISTDNDLTAWLRDNQNVNSFGLRAHGYMWSPTNEQLKFHLVHHIVWDGVDGEVKWKEILKMSLR